MLDNLLSFPFSHLSTEFINNRLSVKSDSVCKSMRLVTGIKEKLKMVFTIMFLAVYPKQLKTVHTEICTQRFTAV